MKGFRFLQRLPAVAVAGTLLSGCSFPSGVQSVALPAGGAAAPSARSGDLLYVSNGSSAPGVDMLTFPQGKRFASIVNIGWPLGMCSDSHGNVWIAAYIGNREWEVYGFAHGATKPTTMRRSRRQWDSCAVDPATGDIAVVGVGSAEGGIIEVFAPMLKGAPKVFKVLYNPFAAAYDDRGNLYVDGGAGSEDEFVFEQLPRGTEKFTYVKLDRAATWAAGNVVWDGKYITVGVATRSSGASVIYRVQVSGKSGKVVDTIKLHDLSEFPRYVISGDQVAATLRGYYLRRIGLYGYPGGGRRTDEYRGFNSIQFITLSTAAR